MSFATNNVDSFTVIGFIFSGVIVTVTFPGLHVERSMRVALPS